MAYYVYALIDPSTMHPRYVGVTQNVRQRLSGHINDKMKSIKTAWIQGLIAGNMTPKMLVLEDCSSVYDAKAAEVSWIEYLRFIGSNLTNGTKGGDGGLTHKTPKVSITSQIKIIVPQHFKEELEKSAASCGQTVTALIRYFCAEGLHRDKMSRKKEAA